ncbi:P-loop containing nucleoside triphosphate hydrolase protein [Obelidium mucronatum]|nr:P-loop containing nucleoside triphosphate hydrolase protein [Obelidium mucronatum]
MSEFLVADSASKGAEVQALPSKDGVTVSWTGLGYSVPDRKTKESLQLLQNISGSVSSGEVLAVLGPSGCGKSTLLDILAGRKRAGTVFGQVLLNGAECPIKKYSSYVTNNEALYGSFTVRETLCWAVELNTAKKTVSERDEKVNELLVLFGLVTCADSRVGDIFTRGISGGEKRRLSIALQLVKETRVIFVDEPTSGLDSAASFKVMQVLKDIAVNRNCAVICTVHQPSPSTYQLFDKVLYLARGGTVFFGKTGGADVEYFEQAGLSLPLYTCISDVVLDHINVEFLSEETVANERIQVLMNAWNTSQNAKALGLQTENSPKSASSSSVTAMQGGDDYIHSFGTQVKILVRRSISNVTKNFLAFGMRLFFMIALAIQMGTTWLRMSNSQTTVQERFSSIFFSIGFLTYLTAIGIPAFLEERGVFYRERLNRTYSVGAFAVANALVSITITFINTLAFSVIAYFLMGLNGGTTKFFTFVAFLFLTLICGEAACLCVAAAFPIFIAALALFCMFNGVQMNLAGYFVRTQNIPAFWKYTFHYWDFQKWAFEAMSANEYIGTAFECAPAVNETSACSCYIQSSLGENACSFSGDDVIKSFGYDDYSYWKSAVIMIAIAIGYRILFYVILRAKKL